MPSETVQMPEPTDRFHRLAVRVEGRLLIKSVCASCGESKVLSAANGSLIAWEKEHDCSKKRSVTVFPGSPEKCGHA